MMDDWNHLMYHQSRAEELFRAAAVDREISRAGNRKRAERMAQRKLLISTVIHALVSAHKAAKMARHDAWLDSIGSLRNEKRARIA